MKLWSSSTSTIDVADALVLHASSPDHSQAYYRGEITNPA
jgi:hypothetical protein